MPQGLTRGCPAWVIRVLDPSRGIQAHRRSSGKVEALRATEDRDPDDVVDSREDLVRQAMGLVAQDPGDASGEQPLALGGEQVGRVRHDVRGQGPVAGSRQGGKSLEGLPRLDNRQVEQRAGGGADALGVRRIDASAPTGPRQRPRPRRPRGSGRPRCPGRTSRGRARPGRGRGSRRRQPAWRLPATDRDDSLRGLRRDQPGEPGRLDHMQRHTRGVGGRNHLVATIDPVLVDEHLDGHPRGSGPPGPPAGPRQGTSPAHAGTSPP